MNEFGREIDNKRKKYSKKHAPSNWVWTENFYFDTMLNNYLFQRLMLIWIGKFNYLIKYFNT
jgi:hypothetical protein